MLKKIRIKLPILIFAMILLIGLGFLATTALGQEQNVDNFVDLEDDNTVRYNQIVGLHGGPLTDVESDSFVVELVELNEQYSSQKIDSMTLDSHIVPDSGVQGEQLNINGSNVDGLVLDTGFYDQFVLPDGNGPYLDPQGEYVVRSSINNVSLKVADQHPESPDGIDIEITNVTENNDVLNLTAQTTAEQPQDYSWSVDLGPENGVVEDNQEPLLETGSNYNILSDNLDGVYSLDQDPSEPAPTVRQIVTNPTGLDNRLSLNGNNVPAYYPGSMKPEPNTPNGYEYELRPYQNEFKLINSPGPSRHVQPNQSLELDYTAVDDVKFGLTNYQGSGVQQQSFSAGISYPVISPDFEGKSLENISLDIRLKSQRSVEASSYSLALKPVNNTETQQDFDVVDADTIKLSEDNIVLSTINVTSSGNNVTDEVSVVRADQDDGDIRLQFNDDISQYGNLEVSYRHTDNPNSAVVDNLLDFGENPGQELNLNPGSNAYVLLEVRNGNVDLQESMNVTKFDQKISTPDQVDMISNDEIESGFDPSSISGSQKELELTSNADLQQNVTESFRDDISDSANRIEDISLGQTLNVQLNESIEEEQQIRLEYNYYDFGGNVSLVMFGGEDNFLSNELGPAGVYDINDSRTQQYDMRLQDVSSTNFDVNVLDKEEFTIRVPEDQDFSGVSGDVEIQNYEYNLNSTTLQFSQSDKEVAVSQNGQSTRLTIEQDHDRDQVEYDFNVSVQTEDSQRSDTVTVNSQIPQGDELQSSKSDVLVINELSIGTGIDYAVLVEHESNGLIGAEGFANGVDLENYRLQLNQELSNNDNLTVSVYRYDSLQQPDDISNVENLDVSDVDLEDWTLVREETVTDESVSVGDGLQSDVSISNQIDPDAFGSQIIGSQLSESQSVTWNLLPQYERRERNENDRAVYNNRLNLGENITGPVSVPVGSELLVTGNQFEEGDILTLRPQEDENRDLFWSSDLTVESSSTVNEHQVVINTSIPNVEIPGRLTGDFELVDRNTGRTVFTYSTANQDISSEIEPQPINLNDDRNATLRISSQLDGYDVFVSSQQLSSQDVLELFTQNSIEEYGIQIDDASGEVRINSLSEGTENIDMIVDDISSEDTFGLEISAVDSDAESTTEFSTVFGPSGSASFISTVDGTEQGTFRTAEGDRVRIGVSVQETDEVTLKFGGSSYPLNENIDVSVQDGTDSFVLVFDTYRASGEFASGAEVSFEDVFEIRGGAEFVNNPELPSISGNLGTGLYPVEVMVGEKVTDIATVDVNERVTENVQTWIMPRGTDANLQNVQELATRQSDLAQGDVMVIEIDATGLDTPELITNETDPAKLVNPYRRAELDSDYDDAEEFVRQEVDNVSTVREANQVNLEAVGDMKSNNRPSPHMLLDKAENIETIVNQGQDKNFYVFINLDEPSFDNFDSSVNNNGVDDLNMFNPESVAYQDHLTDYELTLNFTEDYPYVDSNDNNADFRTSFSLNERRIWTQLPSVASNEEDLDSRFSLEKDENTTVFGDTYIAPGSEVDVVVRDDLSEDVVENPVVFTAETQVQDNGFDTMRENTVSAEFDLSDLDVGREMIIKHRGINEFEEPAIITEPELPPEILSINTDFDDGFVGEEIQFSAEIGNLNPTALEYEWNFGDGEGSQAPSPVHVYRSPGVYDLSLTVTDPETGLNDTLTLEDELNIVEEPRTAPEIRNTIVPDQLNVEEIGEFSVVATSEEVSADELVYNWDFDDGNQGEGLTTEHTYTLEGTYNVQVSVADPEAENPQDPSDELVTSQTVAVDVINPVPDVQEFELEVFTVDQNQTPITNATVGVVNQSGESVSSGDVDQNGIYTTVVEEGEYTVQASSEGFEIAEQEVTLDEDKQVTIEMISDTNESTNQTGGDGGGGPVQPGFTLILAMIALIGSGAYVYSRRYR